MTDFEVVYTRDEAVAMLTLNRPQAGNTINMALAEELERAVDAAVADPEVRVNAVAAGPTMTETVRALIETDQTGAVRAVTHALPLQRFAEVDEIAEAVLFLASARASIITGQVLHANSGGHMA